MSIMDSLQTLQTCVQVSTVQIQSHDEAIRATSTYRCCQSACSISQTCSTSTGLDGQSCQRDGTASSSLSLLRPPTGCSPQWHKISPLPWSCTSWVTPRLHVLHEKKTKVWMGAGGDLNLNGAQSSFSCDSEATWWGWRSPKIWWSRKASVILLMLSVEMRIMFEMNRNLIRFTFIRWLFQLQTRKYKRIASFSTSVSHQSWHACYTLSWRL